MRHRKLRGQGPLLVLKFIGLIRGGFEIHHSWVCSVSDFFGIVRNVLKIRVPNFAASCGLIRPLQQGCAVEAVRSQSDSLDTPTVTVMKVTQRPEPQTGNP